MISRILDKSRRLWNRGRTAYRVFRFPENYFILDRNRYAHHQLSFSQEGEDIILSRLFDLKQGPGFYVDVGAHHPQRFSNTYGFYLRGWRGINIDPLPGSMELFKQIRPKDINIELGISDNSGKLTYYQFNEPALNTFDSNIAEKRDGSNGYRIITTSQIATRRLSDVLHEYLPAGQKIDFLTVDAEGYDLKVLASNDWEKYRPDYILVEEFSNNKMDEILSTPLVEFLRLQGYELISKAFLTLIFLRQG